MTLFFLRAEIPGYGDRCAVTMCERLEIKSTKDTLKLKQAKDEVYLKGFYEGVMLVGECAGMKVGSVVIPLSGSSQGRILIFLHVSLCRCAMPSPSCARP